MLRHGAGWEQGQELANLLPSFISPLEEWLDRQIDRRLVRTLFLAPGRHRSPAPLTVRTALERAGGPHSLPGSGPGWHQTAQQPVAVSQVVPHSLGEIPLAPGGTVPDPAGATGQDGLGHLGRERAGEAGKHRRLFHTAGLCPVRSSKAARLKRIKPGYYNPPGGPPVFVPGLQWLTVMVAGMQGPPLPGRHALVDQPGPSGQWPAGTDNVATLPVR